ncbi:unnamed protein product, partial [Mesorhabditis belari]|uniref:Uncharacterized protein n=1 Tax=Mesorhabditis belari TaxID=2138241 RepID=A0AAF3F8M6_9BILA
MADDVIAICKEEIARMVKKEKPEMRPILRTVKSERNKNPIKMRDKESTEVVIDMDPVNPVLLRHVPPQISGKDSSDKSNANRRAVGCNDNGKYATISKTKRPNLKHPWKV